MRSPEEMAWAAGLFDGEGSASSDRNGCARMQLKMVDEESVRRFARAVMYGAVYGPYRNRTGEKDGYQRRDTYAWVARGLEAIEVAQMLLPWLSTVRRERIATMITVEETRTNRRPKNVKTARSAS